MLNPVIDCKDGKSHSSCLSQPLLSYIHLLPYSHPALTWQQALNESADSCIVADARNVINSPAIDHEQKSMVEWTSKPLMADPCYLNIPNLPQVCHGSLKCSHPDTCQKSVVKWKS